MNPTKVLSKSKWHQDLKKRNYMGLFLIPREVFEYANVNDGTKRLVRIKFDTDTELKGAVTVTSGREIYIPRHLHHYFENAQWFDCEILDDICYPIASLDIL